ncbi:putative HTH-type transcriptional regulator YwnA [compost metagenome]
MEEDALFAVHDKPNPDCPVGKHIQASIEPIFSTAQSAMEKSLERVTLQDIVQNINTFEPVQP